MKKITFTLEPIADSNGIEVPTLIKSTEDGGKIDKEPWGNVQEFDRLFETCARKWGSDWDLEKVCVAITESEIR